jgi:hypothetical protein
VTDFDLQRVVGSAADGLQSVRGHHPDARLDGFVTVAVFAYTDDNDDEREVPVVWSESRRIYPQVGMLLLGLGVMRAGFFGEDDEDTA